LVAERSAVGAEAVALVPEFLERAPGGGTVDGLEDAGGVAVERLAAESGALRLLGDGAVGPVEDGRGVGDAESGR
jgi:hypothetical protein